MKLATCSRSGLPFLSIATLLVLVVGASCPVEDTLPAVLILDLTSRLQMMHANSMMSISAISSLGSATTSLAIHPSSALTHERNGSTTYSFNPASQTNIAVYWGASPATTSDSLLALCQHPNVDIVILAFLGTYFGPGGYPSLKIGGSSCRAATPEQQAIAPGLVDCTAIAPSIAECQQASKPVLLSLGGSSITSSFESDEQAKEFSSTLWALFGADTANETTRSIRPFGPNIVLDGFDLDAESDMPQHYLAFTQALRAKYSKDPGKAYYISGSPHCPIPDTSLPLEAMLLLDWVWPRFYNAKKCNANSKGFLNSVSDWSVQLKTNGTTRPRLYPGVAVSNLTGSGSVRATDLHKHVNGIDISKMGNFGGLMLWDGSLALFEGTDRMNYLDYARNALVKLQDTSYANRASRKETAAAKWTVAAVLVLSILLHVCGRR